MIYERLKSISLILLIVFFTGVSGYQLIEGWSTLDAFYMTVITISSVGFSEVHPLSDSGRIFTIMLILFGTGALVYGVSSITAFIVGGEFSDVLRRRKMQNRINRLVNHYIICGADQTGRYVIDELIKTKRDFLVIEKDQQKINYLSSQEILFIEGDATHNAILNLARIEKAKGLISALHTDADNLLVVLTARQLNPSIRVIAKAVEEESEQKMRMAGADGVVMPNFIGGMRMVSEMLRPSIVTFLDVMLRSKDKTIRVEHIDIAEGSPFKGKTLQATGMLDRQGMTVVALKDAEKDSYIFNPPKTTVLAANHTLVVMGDIEIIGDFTNKARPPALS
ncbi:MAG: NAD-binding protein [Nitrospirae bacterium]|nr:NAD-binding protein [Nitrospirota bacterium]